jgi:hypothetical protein
MELGVVYLDSSLFSAYSITVIPKLALAKTVNHVLGLDLTVIVNVSIFNHIRRESKSLTQSFAGTHRSEISDHRVDTAHGIAVNVLVATCPSFGLIARLEEVNLALSRASV